MDCGNPNIYNAAAAQNANAGQKYIGDRVAVSAQVESPRDLSASELIQNRLRMFQDVLGHNNMRLIEMGTRAFGGNPVGGAIAGNATASKPQPSGHIANISMLLDEIQQMLEVQREAITFIERLA